MPPAPPHSPEKRSAITGLLRAASLLLLVGGIAALGWLIRSRLSRDPMAAGEVIAVKTCAAERARVRQEDRESVIRPALARLQALSTQASAASSDAADGSGNQPHAEWEKLLWTMKWTDYREPDGIGPLQWLFTMKQLPAETRRLLHETVFALYPDTFIDAMRATLETDADDRLCCMAAAYLQRAAPGEAAAVIATLQTRFPDWQNRPRIRAVVDRHAHEKSPGRPPQPGSLLRHSFPGTGPVVFSIQRPDRDHIGRAIVRDSAGNFLRTGSGGVLTLPQFARSVSNLPGHITNGNTPQGLFQIRGIEVCDNAAIGPTEALILSLPGEYAAPPAPGAFHYVTMRGLVPPEWESWQPFLEAEFAGQARRTEILAHGTTIDPENWRGRPFYPQTPSHGCLTCPEDWHPQTGARLDSSQLSLVSAVRQAGGPPGWLVVLETAAKAGPVSEEEVADLVAAIH